MSHPHFQLFDHCEGDNTAVAGPMDDDGNALRAARGIVIGILLSSFVWALLAAVLTSW